MQRPNVHPLNNLRIKSNWNSEIEPVFYVTSGMSSVLDKSILQLINELFYGPPENFDS